VILILILFSSTAIAKSASPAGPYAYILNEESGNGSIIDTSNNTVVASETVGAGPVGVAVSPDGKLKDMLSLNSCN